MGSWGYKIKQDDFVCDVIDSFVQSLKETRNIKETTEIVSSMYSEEKGDERDGPLLWIALAEVQWEYGSVEKKIYSEVQNIIQKEKGLESWKEDSDSFEARKNELKKFLNKISTENTKPKKLPKTTVRKPKYNKGECLSIDLENGMYAAAIVLDADHNDIENGQNLIGVINYLSSVEPSIRDFEKKEWLKLTHHNWSGELEIGWYGQYGHRKHSKKIKVVSIIEITEKDPSSSMSYCSWEGLGQQSYLQARWDANKA